MAGGGAGGRRVWRQRRVRRSRQQVSPSVAGGVGSTSDGHQWTIELSNPSDVLHQAMCTPQRNEAAAAECVATIHVGRERPGPAVPPDAAQAPADSVDLSFATALANAVTLDAHGQYHLYFHAADELVPGFKRCGEVDAAQHMPQSLFAPANFPALAAYAEATVRLYRVPVLRNSVSLGRCASIGFTEPGGGVQGIDWTPAALMGPVCAENCECSFDGVHEAGTCLSAKTAQTIRRQDRGARCVVRTQRAPTVWETPSTFSCSTHQPKEEERRLRPCRRHHLHLCRRLCHQRRCHADR